MEKNRRRWYSQFGSIFLDGFNNRLGPAQSQLSVLIGGEENQVSTNYGTSIGGLGNLVEAPFGSCIGSSCGHSYLYGQKVISSGMFSAPGDAQSSELVLRNITTDATPTELFLDGLAQQIVLRDGSTWAFEILVIARRVDAVNEHAAYKFFGSIKRDAGVATTAILTAVDKTVIHEDTAGWDCGVTADNTNGALLITATGAAASTVRWVAHVKVVETMDEKDVALFGGEDVTFGGDPVVM